MCGAETYDGLAYKVDVCWRDHEHHGTSTFSGSSTGGDSGGSSTQWDTVGIGGRFDTTMRNAIQIEEGLDIEEHNTAIMSKILTILLI